MAIDLPTGEGKSLVFQAIDEVGFASNAILGGDGVTLVIVPTVALAYDHENACGMSSEVPLAYVTEPIVRLRIKAVGPLRTSEQRIQNA